MLLRESSEAIGESYNEASVMGGQNQHGIAAGDELVAFGEALTLGSANLADARTRLRALAGDAGFVQAAGIAAIFNGLVRTADSTGIPLDDNMRNATEQVRARLGINDFAAAQNTLA
jgi:hypothetical protein